MESDMGRACDDDEVDELEGEDRPRCDGCGGVLEPWDAEPPVIYYCFHALHAGCADGRDACPSCNTPQWVPDDDDDQPEPVDEAAAASPPPDNNPDEDSALASDGVGVGIVNDGGGETVEPRPCRCDGDFIKPGSHLGCCDCSCRVTELEVRLEEKSAALTQTTNVLELERAQSRLDRLEEMYGKLEEELIRLRNGKRAREIEDAEESKKPRNGGRSVSSFPQDNQTD